jgi:hypothetical protein
MFREASGIASNSRKARSSLAKTNMRRLVAGLVVLSAVVVLLGCGSATPSRIIVRIGRSSITESALAHRMVIMAPQHRVPDPPHYAACIAEQQSLVPLSDRAAFAQECRQQYQLLRQRALGFLITSHWLVGEAERQRMNVTSAEVKGRLNEKQRAYPHGVAEFQAFLKAGARTVRDVAWEVRAELASEKIRRGLIDGERKVTHGQIVNYYRRNIRRYKTPERRYFYIYEHIKSEGAARRLMREIAQGRSFAAIGFHESLQRTNFATVQGVKRIAYEAIFAAKPNVVAEPVRLRRSIYYLFEVTRITPPKLRPLAQVRGAIERKLTAEVQRRTLAKFIQGWRGRWIARTDCVPGYVVQKCRQYRGIRAAESLVTFD